MPRLRGGAAAKVVAALLARGLIAETATDAMTKADAALNRIWRNGEDGHAVLLHLTDAGLAALGLDADPTHSTPEAAAEAQGAIAAPEAATLPQPAPKAHKARTGTRQATLIAMLRSEAGATIGEIMAATGWQSHTVRGALAGALKKRLGLETTSQVIEGRGRVYRLPPA